MKIVADMNVLFSYFKSDSPKRKLIITSQYVKFYTPSFCIAELLKHKKELCEKARISEEEFSLLLEDMTLFVNVVKEETFKDCAPEALKMLSGHAKDAPYVSLALSLKRSGHKAGIWSNERRLKRPGKTRYQGLQHKGNAGTLRKLRHAAVPIYAQTERRQRHDDRDRDTIHPPPFSLPTP